MAPLAENARKTLITLGREAITHRLEGRRYRPDPPADPELSQQVGAFVTIRSRGTLRGCIGSFREKGPLYRTVAEMARAAAFEDPRFPPLSHAEYEAGVDLEISVLGPLVRVENREEVEPGRHGLCIVDGPNRGVLLPQVATEHGWDRERSLGETCRKAGLPTDAWRRGAEIYVFEAEVFGE